MKPIALLGHTHTCKGTKSSEHKNGPIISGQAKVTVNGIPVAVVGDKLECDGSTDSDKIIEGSSIVKINGKGVARKDDKTAVGGFIDKGEPLVKIE